MFGAIARGAYVLVVGTMIVAWVYSLARPVSAEVQAPAEQVWYVFA